MTTKKKSSRILALVLALVMMLSIVPMSIFAAEADEPVLQNGKAAISSGMTDEQIKIALFDALVSNPEGKNPQDYEWQYYCEGKNTEIYKFWDWVTIKGEIKYAKPPGIIWEEDYHFPALKDNGNADWQVRLAGTTTEVTLTKVSTCSTTIDYAAAQGTVTLNNMQAGAITSVAPYSDVVLNVVPSEGYNIKSVDVNGEVLEGVDGEYHFTATAADNLIKVVFEEVANTQSTLTAVQAEGVTYKLVNSLGEWDFNGSFRVSNSADTTVKFLTDANTSIDKVLVNGEDVTADVVFNNYNGAYTATFAADATIEVVTTKPEVKLTGATKIPVFKDSNDSWDYAKMEEGVVKTLIADGTIPANFKTEEFEITYNCEPYRASFTKYVPLNYTPGGINVAFEWSFWNLFYYTGAGNPAPHEAQLRLQFKGNDQYRASEYVYVTVGLDELPTVNIAVRSGVQEFALKEIPAENGYTYDYAALEAEIYKAVIDEVNSYPAGVVKADTVKLMYYKTSDWDTTPGWVEVGARCPGGNHSHAGWYLEDVFSNGAHEFTFKAVVASTEEYYGSEKEFTIKLVADPIATAEIGIKADYDKNFVLNQNYDRSFDTAAFEAALSEKVIGDCKLVAPEDVKFSYDITADGTYTVKAYAPETAEYHYTEVTFEVVVDVVDNYTAEIVVDETNNNFRIVETNINTYDYAALKQAIVDQMFTINNVQGKTITADDLHFMYVIYDDGMLIKDYIEFEERYHASDSAEVLYNYLHEGGTFQCWAELKADGESYYGTEVYFTINVTPAQLPKTSITVKDNATVTLNINKDRTYDYAGLKQAMLDEILTVNGLPEGAAITADDLHFMYVIYDDGAAIKDYIEFEERQHASDADEILYHYLHQGGEFQFWAELANSEGNYYGSEVYFKANVEINDEFTTKIALKDNYEKNFTLYYNADQSFDYERLHRELFDAIIDTNNSSSNVTFENTVVTYDVTDGMLIHYPDSPLNTVGSDVSDPEETLFNYLHEGGTFTVKFAVPNSNGLFGNSVSVSLNIGPFGRVKTSVVLNGNAKMDYVADPAAVKQYIFDNIISKELSILPEGVTVDDFTFEYWARNYTAGGLPGVEEMWAPFEGMQHPTLAGSYFKQIGAGDHYFRVYYNGNAEYEPSAWTSGYEIISLPKADFDISIKQDYIYKGDELPKDFIQVSDNAKGADINYRMLFTTTTNEGNALVYLQTRDGYNRSDFDLWMNPVITDVFGADWNAMAVLNNGLTIDQYKQLINSDRLYEHFAYWYGMDEADMAVFRETALSRLGGMNHVTFRIGTPAHAAHYDLFVGAYNESFNTAAIHTGMYVKYNSKGAKLIWRENATGLNTINSKNFDFGADATKNGISQSDGNVKYLYTGLFYCSSKPPVGKTGFFIQTAWTKIGTMYCFPITRSFTISVL